MKQDRKWLVIMALLAITLLVTGCSKKNKAQPVVPPPVDTAPVQPATTVAPETTVDTSVDMTEKKPEKSLQELQAEAERNGLLGDVFFDFDRYDLRPEARERLARNAEFLNGEGRDLSFTLEGHCDERGTNEYNLALGQRRATTTLDYLASLGVDRRRVKTISYGEERPFCTESNEACWQKNRRARFVISGRL